MFVESGIKYYSSLYHFPFPFFQMHTKFRRVYETTVILNGDHHNHSLASPAVTTTIAVIHEKEEEEEEEEEKASTGVSLYRSHSDTTVVNINHDYNNLLCTCSV